MPDGSAPVPGTHRQDRPNWWYDTGLRRTAALTPGWRLYDEVHRHTQYDTERRAGLQRRRLATVLDAASRTGARRVRLTPSGDPLAELSGWPVMPKRRFVAELDRLRTDLVDPADVLRIRTSGRTGDPVVVDHEEQLLVENMANQLRTFAAYDLRPGMRFLRVSCDPRHQMVSFVAHPAHPGTVQLTLNVARLDAANAAFVGRLCQEFAPDAVWGPPMEQLVTACRIRSGLLPDLDVRVVLTFGDRLTAATRQVLASVHGAPVHDLYSLDEFGPLAWECPQAPGTYHVNEERVLLERDDDGALVMTNLINRAMAIIRYRPEDHARIVEAPCPCGRTLLRITDIVGRQRGLLIDRDGVPLAVEPLELCLDRLPLRHWRISQDEPGVVSAEIVPGSGADPADLRAIVDRKLYELFNLKASAVRLARPDDFGFGPDEPAQNFQFRLFTTQDRAVERFRAALG